MAPYNEAVSSLKSGIEPLLHLAGQGSRSMMEQERVSRKPVLLTPVLLTDNG